MIELLLKDMIKFPTSERDIANVVDGFCNNLNFPQYVGVIDNSHIEIKPPKSKSTSYYNYKVFYSTVLLAVCDSEYRFTYVNVGAPEAVEVMMHTFLKIAPYLTCK